MKTAEFRGWETLRNGELMSNAVSHGFDLLITCDQSIRHQQDLGAVSIPVLTNTTNNWQSIRSGVTLMRERHNQRPRRTSRCAGAARGRLTAEPPAVKTSTRPDGLPP